MAALLVAGGRQAPPLRRVDLPAVVLTGVALVVVPVSPRPAAISTIRGVSAVRAGSSTLLTRADPA